MSVSPRVAAIWRYPVKSLGGEAIEHIQLRTGSGVPGDRRSALVPAEAVSRRGWRPKSQCMTLLRHERLAEFGATFDDGPAVIKLNRKGEPLGEDRALNAIALQLGVGRLALAVAGDEILTDAELPLVSLINRASVALLAAKTGASLDERRFRANVYFEGAPAWAELAWPGRTLRLGTAEIEIIEPIGRCAATDVNPVTAQRDTSLVTALSRHFGHTQMGVFAAVRAAGEVRVGDPIAAS